MWDVNPCFAWLIHVAKVPIGIRYFLAICDMNNDYGKNHWEF
ncbi:hypothetical protein [Spiroplasma endosymbiont of Stenodema calcarata]